MPVRVRLIHEAVTDLERYAASGNLPLFLKKLIHLEAAGRDAGIPLGRGLTGWRTIVASDRNWRIIFTTDPEETVATVWVIGDGEDAQCYAEAQQRVEALGASQPQAASLAAVLFRLQQSQRAARKTKRRR